MRYHAVMETHETLELLARDAQYDLACACGTSKNDDHRTRGKNGSWLYPVTVPGGGSGIMLKTLMTNSCSNDCRYCPLRCERDYPRLAVQPDRLASFFIDLQSRRRLIGMFLSSGVLDSADRTMQRLIDTAAILRKRYAYRGYIHIKIIPGASKEAVRQAVSLSSAVSINIETPGVRHFSRLSESKDYLKDIIEPMKYISELTAKGSPYRRVSKTTQFIVGASDETDREILTYMQGLYQRLNYSRVYFSSYQKGLGDPSIPGEQRVCAAEDEPFVREHRLYQADFLIRKYGFNFEDFLFEDDDLSLNKDPKQVWADAHPEFYPVNINRASKQSLLRVPGIGPETARRIIKARKEHTISRLEDINVQRYLAEKAREYIIFR